MNCDFRRRRKVIVPPVRLSIHELFEDHLDFFHKLFEATCKHKLKFTRQKCNFAVQKVKLLSMILDKNCNHPDFIRIISIQRYETLNTIHEFRSFFVSSIHKEFYCYI